MSIFDKAEIASTGMKYYDRIRPVAVEVEWSKTGEVRQHQLSQNEEYELVLMIRQNFWANRAQRADAAKYARHSMARFLFQDVVRELSHLRLCITSGDRNGAMKTVDRIQKATEA